jgi:DNA-binding GntR family transcriptional regulator
MVMKTDTVFKRAFNDALDLVAKLPDGRQMPSENVLSRQLGVSRTTVRKVLATLSDHGVLDGGGRHRIVRRAANGIERFPEAQTVTMAAQVEKRFMEWMLRDNARPGTLINELELARQFGVATTGIREFLNRFEHFGLIEKRPNAGWLFKGSRRASPSSFSRSARCLNCARRACSPDSPRIRPFGTRSRRSARNTCGS